MPSPMQLKPTIEKGGMVMKAVTSQHEEALALTGRKLVKRLLELMSN